MTDDTPAVNVDDGLGGLEQAICDILGIPINTDISAAFFASAAGGLTKVILADALANPSAIGQIQRNGGLLKFHDGIAVRLLFQGALVAKSLDQVINNSAALVNLTDLSIPVGANESISGRAILYYRVASTSGIRVAITGPAASVGFLGGGHGPSQTSPLELRSQAVGVLGDPILFGNPAGAGLIGKIDYDFTFYNGGTAGNLVVQAAQATAQANDLTVLGGSTFQITRFA